MSRPRRDTLLVTLITLVVAGGWLVLVRNREATAEWPGVDESVVGRFVESSGRPPSRPLIDWVHGDLLLFAFLVAGLGAGFVLGYFARSAIREREKAPS